LLTVCYISPDDYFIHNDVNKQNKPLQQYICIKEYHLHVSVTFEDIIKVLLQPQASSVPLSNLNKTNSFMVYHQNIRGLLNKTEELVSFLSPNFPQVLCSTEHHLKDSEIEFTYTDQYKLGIKFCMKSCKRMVE